MNEQSRKIYNYILDKMTLIKLMCVAWVGIGIFATISLVNPIPLLFCLAGVFFLIILSKPASDAKKKLISMQNEPLFENLCDDFNNGTKYFSDMIRVGSTFAIGAKTNRFVKISDITRAYVSIRKKNGVIVSKNLMVKENDKTKVLGSIKQNSSISVAINGESELDLLFKQLLSVNPNIRLS